MPPPVPRLTRRLLAAAAALSVLAAACTGSGGEGTTVPPTGDGTVASTAPPTSDPTSGTQPAETTTTTSVAATTTTEDDRPTGPLSDEIAELVEATERVRGLPFLEPPDLAIVSTAELAERIREDVEEELGDIGPEERLYRLLGLLEPDEDLAAIVEELLAEQVLGYYDGDTGELVVAGDLGDELSPLSEITVVHELVHALTDQHFGMHDRYQALVDEDRFDEAAAMLALIEGDATYFQLVYLQEAFDFVDLTELQREIEAQDVTALEASPEFLQADLAFPYDDGFVFVSRLVGDGGIAAVDAAYVDPPTTTEQILHPESFVDGEQGQVVELPSTEIEGYELYEESVYGEWGMSLLFLENGNAGQVTRLGDGWGGDRYRILDNGTDVVLIIDYLADREQDADEIEDAFVDRFEDQFGGQPPVDADGGVVVIGEAAYGYVGRTGDRVLVVAASDPGVGAEVQQLVTAG